MAGRVTVVSLGPGALDQMTPAARDAIEQADVIVGYATYVRLITDLAPHVPRESSGMHHEVERAARAVELAAKGKHVALACGGDAGIYSLAGLVLEVRHIRGLDVPVTILPGVSALNAAAALCGAPLGSDFAVISLSDYLVPFSLILARVEAAARADFVLCLYNPKSSKRAAQFSMACEAIARWRMPETPVGIVKDAYRPGQQVRLTTLGQLVGADVDMNTLVIVGNNSTEMLQDRIVTPRGYAGKYSLERNSETAAGGGPMATAPPSSGASNGGQHNFA